MISEKEDIEERDKPIIGYMVWDRATSLWFTRDGDGSVRLSENPMFFLNRDDAEAVARKAMEKTGWLIKTPLSYAVDVAVIAIYIGECTPMYATSKAYDNFNRQLIGNQQ